jgi:sigma-E factor negative regulatory protein RseA
MNMTSQRNNASSFTDSSATSPDAGQAPAPFSPEWLSSFMDGEAGELDASLPESLNSPQGHARWDTYHLIGDVLRTPELAQPLSSAFHQRFLQALDAESPIIAAPRPVRARRFMSRYGLPGLAAAAAIASVTWMAQPYFGDQSGNVEFSAQASANGPAGGAISQVSVQMPQAQASGEDAGEMSLSDYLDAHRQLSGRSAVRQVSNTSYDSQEGQR